MAIDSNAKRMNVLSVMSPIAGAVLPVPTAGISELGKAQLVHLSGVIALGAAATVVRGVIQLTAVVQDTIALTAAVQDLFSINADVQDTVALTASIKNDDG